MNPGFDLRMRPSSKHGVEEVDEILDVTGRSLVFAIAELQPDILLATQKTIDSEGRPVGLLESERIARRFGEPRVHHQASRGDESHQRILINGQLVLAPGKESQSWTEPVRLHAGEQLDAFVHERLGGVSPRIVFAAVPARR